ncbi:hypothetical protein BDZ94DRAFT_1306391 [Collybia nuda]|uniref:Sorbose reductase sou1 n=1 Tax=Collybia nuda TaxID=64659 RepID=A0A9P6CN71_9AGAR|nr:hypothetical protein BDZ94DRAFT_1306391 [Collybia nuda]
MLYFNNFRQGSRISPAIRTLSNRWARQRPIVRPFSLSRVLYDQGKPLPPTKSASALAPIGVAAANLAAADPNIVPRPKIFEEFSLKGRVGIVSGGQRGLGLEMAMALCEAGATVYCFDLPPEPPKEWLNVQDYVKRIDNGSRLEYVCGNVTDQKGMWAKVEEIGDREKRMDICIAAAGIFRPGVDCLDYPEEQFKEVHNINVNGALNTAQAAGRQMVRFGNRGSIVLIASISGHLTNKGPEPIMSYNTSKSAVLQMGRNLACELGAKNIRVNTISPGFISTPMTASYITMIPGLVDKWSTVSPLRRIGRADELRGVATWLASDASSFCSGTE